MADISHLSHLTPQEPLDLSMYKANKAKPFPKAGRYTARAKESFTAEDFGEAKSSGALVATVNPTIVGGEYDGYELRGVRLSAKTWTDRKSGKPTSKLGQYLAAFGVTEVPSDPQAIANLVETTAGRLLEVVIDWELDNLEHGVKIIGMENFPKDANGNPSRFVTLNGENGLPKVSDPITSEPVTLRAFTVVKWFNTSRN